MKIKVCGMKDPAQIQKLIPMEVDFAGLIFHEKSARYVGNVKSSEFSTLANDIRLTGVFVNKPEKDIREAAKKFGLTAIQLHGDESPELCQSLGEDYLILKAIRMGNAYDFSALSPYAGSVDYFLFDTAGEKSGGTGKKFNWRLLQNYTGETPFFLSGGIAPGDEHTIQTFNHPGLAGTDINSRFETEPGIKDIKKVNQFINTLKAY